MNSQPGDGERNRREKQKKGKKEMREEKTKNREGDEIRKMKYEDGG